MKKIITFLVLLLTLGANAQLLIDDFKTGSLSNINFDIGETNPLFQTGNAILGKTRRIHAKVNQNPFNQSIQLSIKNGLMAMTAAYDTRGTIYVGYGHDKNGNKPLNLDLGKYKFLKIEFAAKSTINGIYVTLFTGTSRAVYSKHVPAREGPMVFTIPFSEIKKIGEKFTFKDIDHIRFQFDSRSKTGCSMAIDKIWFQ